LQVHHRCDTNAADAARKRDGQIPGACQPWQPAAHDEEALRRDPSPEQIARRRDRSSDALNLAAGTAGIEATGWPEKPTG
jgi:hypothetical protein